MYCPRRPSAHPLFAGAHATRSAGPQSMRAISIGRRLYGFDVIKHVVTRCGSMTKPKTRLRCNKVAEIARERVLDASRQQADDPKIPLKARFSLDYTCLNV